MSRTRNLSSSRAEKLGRDVHRVAVKPPLKRATLSEGTITIGRDAQIVFEEGARADLPEATESTAGLMPAEDKQKLNQAGPESQENTLVLRGAGGRAQFGHPEEDLDAVTKGYVDVGVSSAVRGLASVNYVDSEISEVTDYIDSRTPGIEIDTSAGTRVTVGDQVVFYDSGWRDVSGSVRGAQWSPFGVRIRRVGSMVSAQIYMSVASSPSTSDASNRGTSSNDLLSTSLWQGFRTPEAAGMLGSIERVSELDSNPAIVRAPTQNILRLNSDGGDWVGGELLQGLVYWMTNDSIPTSLPGEPI